MLLSVVSRILHTRKELAGLCLSYFCIPVNKYLTGMVEVGSEFILAQRFRDISALMLRKAM